MIMKGIGRTYRPLGQDRLLARWSAIVDLGFLTYFERKYPTGTWKKKFNSYGATNKTMHKRKKNLLTKEK